MGALKTNMKLLAEWKERLGLHDWVITLVDNCFPGDMCLANKAGDTAWSEENKTARIEIMDPQYYGDRITPFDFERILVHELLHLKLSLVSSDVGNLQERYMHQIIEDLAKALVQAKRGGSVDH